MTHAVLVIKQIKLRKHNLLNLISDPMELEDSGI